MLLRPAWTVKGLCLSLLAPPYLLDFGSLKSQGAHSGQANPVLLDWMLVVGIRQHLRDKGQPGAAALLSSLGKFLVWEEGWYFDLEGGEQQGFFTNFEASYTLLQGEWIKVNFHLSKVGSTFEKTVRDHILLFFGCVLD